MRKNRVKFLLFLFALSLFFSSVSYAQTLYCTSSSTTFTYEWIKQVSIGSMSNPSGGSNYSNFSSSPNLVTPPSVQRGASVPYSLTPGFSGSSYQEEWAIFIDYNRNGSFTDPGEKVVTTRSTTNNGISGTFTIPTTSLVGTTKVRVSMRYSAEPPPCGTFTYGEVEDYLINITDQSVPTPSPPTPTIAPSTPTPNVMCTPPPCTSPNSLQCLSGSCLGGCGYTCVPPTPTIAPPTPTQTPAPLCTPPPCTAPNTLVCPTGNCQGGCGYTCSPPTIPSGSLDPAFGTNGKVLFPMPGGVVVSKTSLQSDGKIIIGGVLGAQFGTDRDENRRGTLFVSRFLQNGTPDLSFGNSGSVVIYFGTNDNKSRFKDLILQPDGKFLVLGQCSDNQNYQQTYLWRYHGNGTSDVTFGVNGRVAITPVFLTPQSLALQSDGKLLVGGDSATSGPTNLRVVRLLSNGSVDTSFGVNGEFRRATVNVRHTRLSVTSIAGQERIMVAALTDATQLLTLIRLNLSGIADLTFGTNGVAMHTIDPNYTGLYGWAINQDGRAFSYGESMPAPTYSNKYFIARTKVNGSLDETFGAASGVVHYPWGGAFLPRDFTIQNSSQSSQPGSGWPRTLVSVAGAAGGRIDRLSEIGAPDTTFGTAGSTLLPDMTAGARLQKVMGGSRLIVVGTNSQGIIMYRLGL